MKKLKLCVILGGMSTEHEVSITSGTSIIQNLDKEKYQINVIYIDKKGEWFEYIKPINEIKPISIGEKIEKDKLIVIENKINFLKKFNVVFPILHGKYGEDGTMQGLLELLNIKYVGCKVLSSSICMDKIYSKIIFEKANIPQAKYIYIKKIENIYKYIDDKFNEKDLDLSEIGKIIEEKLGFPVFVKPSNSGSSVGIKKANNVNELQEAIEYASNYDDKILIEEEIIGREVECAVLGNKEVRATCIGEINSAENFYTYDAKYKNNESKTIIPANISKEKEEEIKALAKKAFKAVDGKGLSRVDFFIRNSDNKVIINEINTMPGFTEISMYPKLWEKSGIKYSKLLDELIKLAIN